MSPQTLINISKVLQINKLEYEYLCNLMTAQSNYSKEPDEISSELTSQLLFQLNPIPALLMNNYLDIITYNQSFELMIGFSINKLSNSNRNYLDLTINHSAWQQFLCIDTDEQLKSQVTRMAGFFRNTLARLPNDVILKNKIEYFRKISYLFNNAWKENNVLQPEDSSSMCNHKILGHISLSKQLWWNTNVDRNYRLNVYHPIDSVNIQQFNQLYEKYRVNIA